MRRNLVMVPADNRPSPPLVAPEREMLAAWLDHQRATLAWKCDGLSPADLARRSVPPSTLSLLGVVRHMTDVERHWFRRTFAGEDVSALYSSGANPEGDFDDIEDTDPGEVLARWRAECDHARSLVTAAPSLDAIAERPRRGRPVSLRWIAVHMVEEYARHNGHADLLRQCIDGAVGY